MDYANPSKPDTHEINRVETDLLLAMSALTQRQSWQGGTNPRSAATT